MYVLYVICAYEKELHYNQIAFGLKVKLQSSTAWFIRIFFVQIIFVFIGFFFQRIIGFLFPKFIIRFCSKQKTLMYSIFQMYNLFSKYIFKINTKSCYLITILFIFIFINRYNFRFKFWKYRL